MFSKSLSPHFLFRDVRPTSVGLSRSSAVTCQEPLAMLGVIDKTMLTACGCSEKEMIQKRLTCQHYKQKTVVTNYHSFLFLTSMRSPPNSNHYKFQIWGEVAYKIKKISEMY